MTTTTAELAAVLLSDTTRTSEPAGFAAAMGDFLARLRDGRPILEVLPCGFGLIDEAVGGLVRREYVGLIGDPGTGKSTLADALVVSALLQDPGLKAIIFALETAPPVRLARLVSRHAVRIGPANELLSCLPLNDLLRGTVGGAQLLLAEETGQMLGRELDGRLTFYEYSSDALEIAEVIRGLEPDLVLIDHLGLVTVENASSDTSRIDHALGTIFDAIRQTNAAGIIINETSKAAQAGDGSDLSSSRGSARFASLASLFIKLEQVPGDTHPTVIAKLAKNRFGLTHLRQQGTYYGGLAYFAWEDVAQAAMKRGET